MATTDTPDTTKTAEFAVQPRSEEHPDAPEHVHVEISPVRRDMLMAILAAGVDGRYSFDFVIGVDGADIKKAYVEGMREDANDLPDWVDSVEEQIEEELGV